MRIVSAVAAVLLSSTLALSAQPNTKNTEPRVRTAGLTYDDLSCAARYTLAAVVIRNLDGRAAEYYMARAADAGDRYLRTHPGESEASYTSRVTSGARDLQDRLAKDAMSPQSLVADIKRCDRDADSRVVM